VTKKIITPFRVEVNGRGTPLGDKVVVRDMDSEFLDFRQKKSYTAAVNQIEG
jgi:hypothetical protein